MKNLLKAAAFVAILGFAPGVQAASTAASETALAAEVGSAAYAALGTAGTTGVFAAGLGIGGIAFLANVYGLEPFCPLGAKEVAYTYPNNPVEFTTYVNHCDGKGMVRH